MASIGPWKNGIDNRLPEYSIPQELKARPGEAAVSAMLRNAVNVDLDNTGRARSRRGLTRVYDGVGTHSVYACPLGTFFVEAGVLKKLTAANSAQAVVPGIVGKVAYEYVNGTMYFCDSLDTYKLTADGVSPWGVAPPTLTAVGTSGLLPPGRYTVMAKAVDASGEESGSSNPIQLDLPSGGGVAVTTSSPARVFMTTANGSVFYSTGATPSSARTITTLPSGEETAAHFVTRPPVGDFIRYYRGRIYVGSKKGLWYSDAYAFGWFDASNFLQFTDDITVFEPVEEGIWIVHGDETAFIRGENPDDFRYEPQLWYGAVAKTTARVPNSKDVLWMSHRGAVLGNSSGKAANLQERFVAVNPGSEGAAIVRERDGIRQFIATLTPTSTSEFASPDWAAAETTRKGN